MRELPPDLETYFRGLDRRVVTFVGYSAAGYEDPGIVARVAGDVLAEHDPARTVVNGGATADGVGAVYRLARSKGYPTTGIVSSLARDRRATLSPFVDRVFFVEDERWGGRLPGTHRLSPTSAAMVAVSDVMVGIGGGEIARDELLAALRARKEVRFHPADMNHRRARDAARRRGRPEPTDFRGAAAETLTPAAGGDGLVGFPPT